MTETKPELVLPPWRKKLHEVIFEANAPLGTRGAIRACMSCSADNHDEYAVNCKHCGTQL